MQKGLRYIIHLSICTVALHMHHVYTVHACKVHVLEVQILAVLCGDENLDAESEIRGGRGAPKMSVESGVEKVAVSVPKSQGEKKRTYVM